MPPRVDRYVFQKRPSRIEFRYRVRGTPTSLRKVRLRYDELTPVASGIEPEHTILIGTLEGDLHDIGKNLVMMMLKGANFKVVDLVQQLCA